MYDQHAHKETDGQELGGSMQKDRDEELFKIGSAAGNGTSMESNEGDKENDKETPYI